MSIKATYMVPHPPLIIKEIGKGSEQDIIKTINSYESISKEIESIKPETIIISTPHTDIFSDYFYVLNDEYLEGDFSNFNASEVKFKEKNDLELVHKIDELCKKNNFPGGILENRHTELDHGTMIPLYFIRKYLKDYKIVVIGISGFSYVDHYKMGKIIKEAVDDLNKNVVYIASGDLSHKLKEYGPYGYIEEGPIYDKKIMDIMSKGDFIKLLEFDKQLVEKAAVCGHKSFIMMSGTLDGIEVESKYLSHEDITGVGYGICTYHPKEKSNDRFILDNYLKELELKLKDYYNNSDDYVKLAKNTIDEYIKNNRIIEIPYNINKELLNNRKGVFVSIHKFNELRGCIGTIYPTTSSIAQEIINNAISASTKDYRFDPIEEDELKYLEINVDVLTTPEFIKSKDELDIKKYGVIVSSGYKRGLLLPDIDGIESIDEQISIAKKKGDINDDEEIALERFEVIRHKGAFNNE